MCVKKNCEQCIVSHKNCVWKHCEQSIVSHKTCVKNIVNSSMSWKKKSKLLGKHCVKSDDNPPTFSLPQKNCLPLDVRRRNNGIPKAALNHTLAVNIKLVKSDCDRVQIGMMKYTTSEWSVNVKGASFVSFLGWFYIDHLFVLGKNWKNPDNL